MAQFLSSTEARIVLALGLFSIVAVVAYYIVSKVRAAFLEDEEVLPDDLMGNVGDLYSEGELSEEEYRAIRSQMASRMVDRLNRKRPKQ